MRNLIFLLLLLLVISFFGSFTSFAFEDINDQITTDTIFSNTVQDSFVLHIYLPEDYYNAQKEYPVLLQLDGRHQTIANAERLQTLRESGLVVDDIIMVGIGYIGSSLRSRDYLPTNHPKFKITGGAANFYQFLKTELKPHLESNYRVDTTAGYGLKGHSYGGLFTTYALFHYNLDTSNFINKFIIESPSLFWDSGIIISYLNTFLDNQNETDLPIRLYAMVGRIPYLETIEQRLSHLQFQRFQFEVISKTNHKNAEENSRGLEFIYREQLSK